MRRKFLMIILFVMFMTPIVSVNAQQDESDNIVYFPDQSIRPDSKVFVALQWDTMGDSIHIVMEFDMTVSAVYFINSTTKHNIQYWNELLNFDTAVHGIIFYEVDTIDYRVVLPYDDTFYFMVVNDKDYHVQMNGWYSSDLVSSVEVNWIAIGLIIGCLGYIGIFGLGPIKGIGGIKVWKYKNSLVRRMRRMPSSRRYKKGSGLSDRLPSTSKIGTYRIKMPTKWKLKQPKKGRRK